MEKLGPFTPEELQLMLSGEQIPQWTREDIMNYTEPKFGYTRDTPGFQKFVNVLVSMSGDERKVRTFHLFPFVSFHSFARSFRFVRSFGSLVRLFARSFVRCHPFVRSFVSLVRSFVFFVPSFVHSFVRSFVRSFVAFICSSVLSSVYVYICRSVLLLHMNVVVVLLLVSFS